MLRGEQSRHISLYLANLKPSHGIANKIHGAPFTTNVFSIRKNIYIIRDLIHSKSRCDLCSGIKQIKIQTISKSFRSPNASSSTDV